MAVDSKTEVLVVQMLDKLHCFYLEAKKNGKPGQFFWNRNLERGRISRPRSSEATLLLNFDWLKPGPH